jgi:hypothetical protein
MTVQTCREKTTDERARKRLWKRKARDGQRVTRERESGGEE